jgi:hypothetical protein
MRILTVLIVLLSANQVWAQFNYNAYAHPKYLKAIERINLEIEDEEEDQVELWKEKNALMQSYHRYDSLANIALTKLNALKLKKANKEAFSEAELQAAFNEANDLLTKKNNLDGPIYQVEKRINAGKKEIEALMKERKKWELRVEEEERYRNY